MISVSCTERQTNSTNNSLHVPYVYKFKLERVYDGDTIFATIDLGFNIALENQGVRLLGINTPELSSPLGKHYKRLLKSKLGPNTLLQILDPDVCKSRGKYGRILAILYDDNGQNINKQLLEMPDVLPFSPTKKICRQLLEQTFSKGSSLSQK